MGTWRGRGVSYWIDGGTGQRFARVTWDVTLRITDQKENRVVGTLTLVNTKQENLGGGADWPIPNFGPDAITNTEVGDTRLRFHVDTWWWEFTFTTDLMSGQFTTLGQPGVPCDPKSFVLNRLGIGSD